MAKYAVYILGPKGEHEERTETASPAVAALAFRELLARDDLIGSECSAVFERNGGRLYSSQYAAAPGAGRIHPWAPVDPFASPLDARKIVSWAPACC